MLIRRPLIAYCCGRKTIETESRAAYLALIRRLAVGSGDRYDVAVQIWKISLARAGSDDWIYHPSWLIWGCLTDWVENRPHEREEAEAEMIEAANEFLALDGNPTSEREYFGRWVYDRCGYERT